MKTLVISSYHAEWTPKVEPVKEMVSEFSPCEAVSDAEVRPGFDLVGFDAVVMTGSPSLISRNEYMPRYLDFLRQLTLPVLGICYGHQLIALSCGARVYDGGKFIEGYDTVRILEPGILFRGLPDEVIVMESHREHVDLRDMASAGFDVMASSTTCDVEAFHHTARPLFGVQFHIERSGEIGRQVMGNFLKFAIDYRRSEAAHG